MYDFEMWRHHHEELLREAEQGRLARKLRSANMEKTPRIGTTLLGRVRFWFPKKRDLAENPQA